MAGNSTTDPASTRSPLAQIGAGMAASAAAVGALSVSIAVADAIGLPGQERATWIMVQFGLPGLLSLVLAWHYRQPLFIIPNTTSMIFFGSLAGQLSWSQMVGATLVAGLVILGLSAFRLITHLATLIPTPIVFAIIAAALMPRVVGLFTDLRSHPAVIGSMLIAFLLGPRLISTQVPPVVFALIAGIATAGIGGRLSMPDGDLSFATPIIIAPEFSLAALVTIVPVVVMLVALQGNLASVVYLRSQEYHPPERVIDTVTGASTAAASAFGAVPVSMAGFITPIVGGPDSGDRERRYRSVYLVAATMIVIALLSGLATQIPMMIPGAFLVAIIGLAALGVLQQALYQISKGPVRLGPLIAFVVGLSDLTLFGLGPIFWAVVVGISVTLVLERREYTVMRSQQ